MSGAQSRQSQSLENCKIMALDHRCMRGSTRAFSGPAHQDLLVRVEETCRPMSYSEGGQHQKSVASRRKGSATHLPLYDSIPEPGLPTPLMRLFESVPYHLKARLLYAA